MSLQQEVDAIVMEPYATATIEDLEFGLKNAERAARDASMYSYRSIRARNKDIAMWQHHADLLRAELARRETVTG